MFDYSNKQLAQLPNSFNAQKKIRKLKVYFAKTVGVLNTLEGDVHYQINDAILTGTQGEQWPVQYQKFINSYQAIAPTQMGEDGDYQTNPITVTALKAEQPCQVTINSGDILTGQANDYVLQYDNGDYSIVSAKIFEEIYQPLIENSPKTTFDLFISHSSKDIKFVEKLANHLEANHLTCWYAPRDIEAGEQWPKAITQAIKQAPLTILIFSEASNQSEEVAREIALASNLKCPIIAIRIDNITPSDELLYQLTNRHWLDVVNLDEQRAIEKIQQDLNNYLQQPKKTFNQAIAATYKVENTTTPPKKKWRGTINLLIILIIISMPWLIKNFYNTVEKIPSSITANTPIAEQLEIYTNDNNTTLKILALGNKGDNTCLAELTNIKHPLTNQIFECYIQYHLDAKRYTVLMKDGSLTELFITENNNATLLLPNNTKMTLTYNAELSAQESPKQLLTRFLKQAK